MVFWILNPQACDKSTCLSSAVFWFWIQFAQILGCKKENQQNKPKPKPNKNLNVCASKNSQETLIWDSSCKYKFYYLSLALMY